MKSELTRKEGRPVTMREIVLFVYHQEQNMEHYLLSSKLASFM